MNKTLQTFNRYGHATEYCGGRFYCMGGWGGVRRLRCVETYDWREGLWRRDVEEMGQTRNLFASCALNDCIYAVGEFQVEIILFFTSLKLK